MPRPAPKGLELPTIERLLQRQHGAPRRRVACQARGAHARHKRWDGGAISLGQTWQRLVRWCCFFDVTSGASQGLASTRPLTSPTIRIQASHIGWCVASIPFSERVHPQARRKPNPLHPRMPHIEMIMQDAQVRHMRWPMPEAFVPPSIEHLPHH